MCIIINNELVSSISIILMLTEEDLDKFQYIYIEKSQILVPKILIYQ